jgi:type I restriction enzyme, S subunit
METLENSDLTQHRVLPGGWSFDSIGNLFDIRQGKSLARHKQTGKQKKKFLRTANVLWGKLNLSELDEMDFSPSECEALALKSGDLLVCEGGDIGRTAVWRNDQADCYYQNHLHRLRARDSRINPQFVMFWMQAAITLLHTYEGFGNKTTIPNLSRSRLSEFVIPVPEVSEQEKIAAVLWKIQKAGEIENAIVRNTCALKKSLLRRLLTQGLRGEPLKETEIGPMPKSWDILRISDVAKISSGGTPDRTNSAYWQNGTIPWVKTGEIDYCVIRETGEKITELGLRNSAARLYPKGTLLIAMYGQGITRGRVAILDIEAAINQACGAFVMNGEVITEYLYHYLAFAYERLRSLAHGANQQNLNARLVSQLQFPKPSEDEQREIAEVLQTVDRKIDIHESKKRSLQELFKTLLHKMMTAQIRVNDLDIETNEVTP